MNATKRKLETLLDTNKSNTAISSSTHEKASQNASTPTAEETEAQKRRRISDRFIDLSRTVKPLRPTTSISRTSAFLLSHKKSASLSVPTSSQDVPRYAPWDREAFLKRLKSFSSLTDWTPKPARVNEVAWAKRGWVCQKQERVRCCLCNKEILVRLNKKEVEGREEDVYVAQNIEDALVDKYVELIVESHDESCLWRQRGCDDTIFKMPLNNAATTLEVLRHRYDDLATRKDTLPYYFNLRTPENYDVEAVLSQLPQDFFRSKIATTDESGSTQEVNKVAFTMALFGWQGHNHERLGTQAGSVSCQACFRVLGLWLFKSKEVNDAGKETSAATVNCLDVVTEHRDYCPWRNTESQSGLKSLTGSLPGWEVLLRMIKNEQYLRMNKDGSAKKAKAQRPTTPQSQEDAEIMNDVDDEDAKSIRDEEDKKRWARLRRVKSLFGTKNGKKV